MTLPVNATPATGVLDGQEAGVLELMLGVQPPPPPPPPEVTIPPQPQIEASKRAAQPIPARLAEIESERRVRGGFTIEFPILCISGSAR